MNRQIEQAAQQHADKHFIEDAQMFYNEPWDKAKERYAKTLADFAEWALQKQWVSVDERLPTLGEEVLTYTINSVDTSALAYYDGEDWYNTHGEHIRPHYWLPIPQLNPEKEER